MHKTSVCVLDCPDSCSIEIEVEDGRLVNIDGDTRNPLTNGYICGKVEAVSKGDPIRVGGVTIEPGAIIFGDNDGVMVIAAAHLDSVIEKAGEIKQWEGQVHRQIAEGRPVKEALASAGAMP